MPLGKLPIETVRAILAGGASICAEAGIPVAGGHSIDSVEPIYGLAVIGLCSPDNVRKNSGARPGDALILTKGIGVGVYSAAFKKQVLSDDAYAEMVASTTLLNRVGQTLGANADVHGITDVTGFGLLGHGLELARGAGVRLQMSWDRIPFLSEAQRLAQSGYVTGASGRNWSSYGDQVVLQAELKDWQRALLTDPQTSGGLLVACAPEQAEAIHASITAAGYPRASIIGHVAEGEAAVEIV
jgi:selenide,water dikinase